LHVLQSVLPCDPHLTQRVTKWHLHASKDLTKGHKCDRRQTTLQKFMQNRAELLVLQDAIPPKNNNSS